MVVANQKEANNIADIAAQTIDPISSIKQGTRNALLGSEPTKTGPRLGQVLAIQTTIIRPAELNYFSNQEIVTEGGEQEWMCAICRIPDMHSAVPDPDSALVSNTTKPTIKDWSRLRANIGKFYAPKASILAKGVTSVEIGDWLEVEFQDNTILTNGIIKSVYHKTNAAGYGAPGTGGSVPSNGGPTGVGSPGFLCDPNEPSCSQVKTSKEGVTVCIYDNNNRTFPSASRLKDAMDKPFSGNLSGPLLFINEAYELGLSSPTGDWAIEPNVVTWILIAKGAMKENGGSNAIWTNMFNTYKNNPNANLAAIHSRKNVRGIRNNNPQNVSANFGLPTVEDKNGNRYSFPIEPKPGGDYKAQFFKAPTMPVGFAGGMFWMESSFLGTKSRGTLTSKCFNKPGGPFCGWSSNKVMTFRQLYYTLGTPNQDDPESYLGGVLAALKAYGCECKPDEFVAQAVIRCQDIQIKGVSAPIGCPKLVARCQTALNTSTPPQDPDNFCPPRFEDELAGKANPVSPTPAPANPTPATPAPAAPSAPLPIGQPRF
jgi:hypothetical protein